jgi:cardiolipin synthase
VIPVFLFFLVDRSYVVAALLFGAIAGTDFVDGRLARRRNQVSRLGTMLDPVADRLLILAAAIGVLVTGAVPWALVILLIVREVATSIVSVYTKARGQQIEVRLVGKWAAALVFTGIPLYLVADALREYGAQQQFLRNTWGSVFDGLGDVLWWGATVVTVAGLVCGFVTLWLYVGDARRLLRENDGGGR